MREEDRKPLAARPRAAVAAGRPLRRRDARRAQPARSADLLDAAPSLRDGCARGLHHEAAVGADARSSGTRPPAPPAPRRATVRKIPAVLPAAFAAATTRSIAARNVRVLELAEACPSSTRGRSGRRRARRSRRWRRSPRRPRPPPATRSARSRASARAACSTGSGSVPKRAPRWKKRDPAAARGPVVQRARPRLGLLGRVDLRAHHALDAEVERPRGAPAHVGLDAHQRVHARGGRAQQLAEQLRLVAAAVLEVDEQPVEAGQPERLGGQRAAERQERAEQRLARGQAGLHRRLGGH